MRTRIRDRRKLLPAVAGAAPLSAGLHAAAPVTSDAALAARPGSVDRSGSAGADLVPPELRVPSRESIRDGSLVEATKVVASVPVAGAIPQLLLQAARIRGDGVFVDVTYVQRLDTVGCVKPTTRCVQGQTQGVPCSAVYTFYAHA